MKKKEMLFMISVVANIVLVIMVVNLKFAAVNNQAKADYFSEVCDYKQDHLMEVVCDYQKLSEKISSLNADVAFYKSRLYNAEEKLEAYEALFANLSLDMNVDDDEYEDEDEDEDDDIFPSLNVTPIVSEKPVDKATAMPSITPCPTKRITPTPTLAPPASTSTSATTKKKTERPSPTYYGIR